RLPRTEKYRPRATITMPSTKARQATLRTTRPLVLRSFPPRFAFLPKEDSKFAERTDRNCALRLRRTLAAPRYSLAPARRLAGRSRSKLAFRAEITAAARHNDATNRGFAAIARLPLASVRAMAALIYSRL